MINILAGQIKERNLKSFLRNCNKGIFFLIYTRHSTLEETCAITVAIAAPSTPMPKQIIKIKSSTTLMMTAMIRKNSGVRLSPSARMTLESKLKLTDAKIPNKIIEINYLTNEVVKTPVTEVENTYKF